MLTRILLIFCLGLPGIAQGATTLLVFGDSLSSGYGIPLQRGWVYLLQSRLDQSHPGHRVVNASLSGETSHGGAYRIEKALTTHKPDIVIVELGGNDGLRGLSLADTERNLAKIIGVVQRNRAKVLLVGLRLPPNYGMAYTRQFEDMYHRLARRYHLNRVPFMLEGLGGAQFLPDRVHPNAAAQSLILENVWLHLRPILQRRIQKTPHGLFRPPISAPIFTAMRKPFLALHSASQNAALGV